MELITNKDRVLDTLSKLPNLSNKELYALHPKIDQGSIRNYKHLFQKSITNGEPKENKEIVITPTTPGKKKKSKVSSKKEVKESFHELDPDMMAMKDSELIRHTCREIISTKGNDHRIRLQASNLLLSFADKTGEIRPHSENSQIFKKFKSMPIKDLVQIIAKQPSYKTPYKEYIKTSEISDNIEDDV